MIVTNLDLNDSEILKLEQGPLAWARLRQGSSMNIDQFAKALKEQIEHCGFKVEIKVFDTDQANTYGFEAEINGRQMGSFFDPDRQVHEVTNNLLELPGEEKGFIKTKEAFKRLMDRTPPKNHKH